jgi:hypothetical protein
MAIPKHNYTTTTTPNEKGEIDDNLNACKNAENSKKN